MAQRMAQGQKQQLMWDDRLHGLTDRVRQHLEDGALTDAYRANPEEVIAILNRALASEWSAFLQYWHHYFMASDLHSLELKEFWKDEAEEELDHARRIGERIQLLGGVPCNRPEEIARQTPTPVEYGHDLRSMLEADLAAERATIVFYSDIVRLCGNDDIVTRRMFEEILEDEEEHADRLATLLFAFDASTGEQIATIHERVGGMGGRAGARTQEPTRMAARAASRTR